MLDLQFTQRTTEEILAGQAETVDRASTILAKKHLVEVGLENFVFVVVQLEQDRHQRLGGLTSEAALIAQIEVLDQLLSQGTTALPHATCTQVDPGGTSNGLGRNTKMIEELTILDRYQSLYQVRRRLLQLDQDAIFVMRRIESTNHQRPEPRYRQFGVIRTGKACHEVARKTHANTMRLPYPLIELEPTR